MTLWVGAPNDKAPPSLVNAGTVIVQMILICHVILQHQLIKRLRDFMGGSPSR